MDQGVTSALKSRYVSHYLNEILVVFEEDIDFDTRGERTLGNIKNYNIRSAVHDFAAKSCLHHIRKLICSNGYLQAKGAAGGGGGTVPWPPF